MEKPAPSPFTMPTFLGVGWPIPKIYHWTYSRRRRLMLHAGIPDKCHRVHRNSKGVKEE